MDAVDYVLTKRKICRKYPCTDCPLYPCDEAGTTEAKARKHVEIVEKWKKEREDKKKRGEIIKHIKWLTDNGAECFVENHEDGDKFVIEVDFPKGGDDGKA